MQAHPIWLFCVEARVPGEEDGPPGGDESWMRPVINSRDVGGKMFQPLILLRVRGTEYFASGLLYRKGSELSPILIYVNGYLTHPRDVRGLQWPVTYVAVPTIDGRSDVEFVSQSANSDEAKAA